MIRAQSTHSPGHITTVGLGTYVDPDMSGGAANKAARKSKLHKKLVRKIDINGHVNLLYMALPINVAIIRGTTADAQGNISLDGESLQCDQKIIATAAKNSGGLVIAQVKQLAASGSVPSRKVAVPGALVDCVVIVDEEDHDTLHEMSFEERYNPALVGQLVTPRDEIKSIALSTRKIIARRAFFGLRPNMNVNLGIGLPEGIASVAAEEGMLDYVNFSTEPGVFGGVMASGRRFGPALNASAVVEMNQMFDYYGKFHVSKYTVLYTCLMSCFLLDRWRLIGYVLPWRRANIEKWRCERIENIQESNYRTRWLYRYISVNKERVLLDAFDSERIGGFVSW
jgi:propionate CoA-transferase